LITTDGDLLGVTLPLTRTEDAAQGDLPLIAVQAACRSTEVT